MTPKKLNKSFPVSSICHADLEAQGFDVTNITDGDMELLASRMGESWCDNGYWETLEIMAEYYEIPRTNPEQD